VVADESSVGGEAGEDGAEALVADAQEGTQLVSGEGHGGEGGEDGGVEVDRGGRVGGGGSVEQLEVDGVVVADEGECEGLGRGSGAVLDGEAERVGL
jgi:hypothetical protein